MNRLSFLACCAVLALCGPAAAQDMSASAPTQIPASAAQVKLSYAPVVKQVAPAVVNIYTKRVVSGRGMGMFMNDPLFAPFFEGFAPLRQRVEQSLGSGFIVDAGGLIVTNAHVIKDAEEIVAVTSDGREYEASIELADEPSDLGLLRIDTKGATLPVAKLGSGEGLEVGDLVLAIGNPFGVGQTVTSGIISAVARSNKDASSLDFFIQTDAAINPGNSGGPLVGMDGTVIGVNSAIYSKSGGSLGIGFAIPVEMVRAVIAAKQSGQVSSRGVVRPWLGFSAQNVTADIASSMNLPAISGALVSDVAEGGPAAQAGLLRSDVITAIGGHPVKDADELKFRIATIPIGTQTQLAVTRKGTPMTLTFTAAPPPEKPARDALTVEGGGLLAGATVINVSPAVIEEMALKGQETGVVVQSVAKGSMARRIGLAEGDGIIAIGRTPVQNTRQLKSLAEGYDPSRNGWVLTIRRMGRDQTIILR